VYVSSAGLLVLLAAWKFGLPVWQLPRSQSLPFASHATAFVLSAGICALLRFAGPGRALWLTTLSTSAIFGMTFLGFITTRTHFSRAITILVFLSGLVLVPAPYVIGISRVYRARGFGALLAAAAVCVLAFRLTPVGSLQTGL
jgi:hypothetical protein